MSEKLMENAIHRFVDESDIEDLFDDDIDTFDEDDNTMLEFETDDDGNYIRIVDHLLDTIEVGEARPNPNHRAELFHESVIETVLEMWTRCKQMCARLIPRFPYVGIVLDISGPAIGGFSRKHRRDEQKGTIIECINSGRIVTLVTPGLMERNYFVFLPNAETLSAMQEFPLLTEAPYRICFVSKTGDVRLSDIDISYKSIANVIIKDLYIQDMLVSALEGYDPTVDVDDVGEIPEYDYSDVYDDEEQPQFSDDDSEFLRND